MRMKSIQQGFSRGKSSLYVFSMIIIVLASLIFNENTWASISPLELIQSKSSRDDILSVRFSPQAFEALRAKSEKLTINFPISAHKELSLEMEPFRVLAPDIKIVSAEGSIEKPITIPDVIMFSGKIIGEPYSDAFLAFTEKGSGHGFISLSDKRVYYLAHSASSIANGDWWEMAVLRQSPLVDFGFPESITFCGSEDVGEEIEAAISTSKAPLQLLGGPRVVRMAIDADQAYVDIFGGDLEAAAAYIVQLLGIANYIYQRDLNMKIELGFLRLWPNGGEPFDANDRDSFQDYWQRRCDTTGLNLIELISGRRDLDLGGTATRSGSCSNDAFGIQGHINGSFYPSDQPNLGNWDILVTTHEWGHNFGANHTHENYDRPDHTRFKIDSCAFGYPARGTIMSYCHLHPGSILNFDLRFHAILQQDLLGKFDEETCHEYDCNANDIIDYWDIVMGVSPDVNGNNVPDECEDCNSNGILDDIDISGGTPDVNGNLIPDECEADCNGNLLPDSYELQLFGDDLNGNNVPDECDPDCDGDGISDYTEISTGLETDNDRNAIPDICQDCNGNQVPDWLDLGKEHFIYLSDLTTNSIQEYHIASGVMVNQFDDDMLNGPLLMEFGPDHQLYIANLNGNNILRLNVDNGTFSEFVGAGSGGLDTPTALTFDGQGRLLVASYNTNNIIAYDALTGDFIDNFIAAGSGGLVGPQAVVLGPDDNLYVAGANRVLKYSGFDGSFIEEFVSAGSGGLVDPRGMVFRPNGSLLVTSGGTNQILEYDGVSGEFLRIFSDESPLVNVGDITLGPNGNVFLVVPGSVALVREYEYALNGAGRFYLPRIRSFEPAGFAIGIALRPNSVNDCNGNDTLDICDIANETLTDANLNGYPDECEGIDSDHDGVADFVDNCMTIFNPGQVDDDYDNVGNACDLCNGYDDNIDADYDNIPDHCDNCLDLYNPYQADSDSDQVGDACDNCPFIPNYDQIDNDSDGSGDVCDICQGYNDSIDSDGDYHADGCDNCDLIYNPDQYDLDQDQVGDSCDNCLMVVNTDQADSDSDGVGNLCDVCPGYDDNEDYDEDNVPDSCDNCPANYNPDQADADLDGQGNACDILCGDNNNDWSVNVGDVVYLMNHIFHGGPPPQSIVVGDVNCDGSVNIGDAVYLGNYIFEDGPSPCIDSDRK